MKAGGAVALVAVPVMLLGGCMTGTLVIGGAVSAYEQSQQTRCGGSSPGGVVDVGNLPGGSVAGYSGEQLANATQIMNAGAALGLTVRDQTIGVMTAMGESSLRVLDYGDSAGPDSRGLFQQRDNGAWGSYADRMDPYRSATSFFRVLAGVQGRDQMQPTRVANRVQRNADPNHYTRWWDPAVAVVDALTLSGALTSAGAPATPPPAVVPAATPAVSPSAVPGAGAGAQAPAVPTTRALCGQDGAAVPVGEGGWAQPAAGPYTSGYGMRFHPIRRQMRLHGGIDLAPGCDSPINAATSGVVARSGPTGDSYGTLIVLDHAGGVSTYYAHMYADDLLVDVGQQVTAGQQIARVGSSGGSTGCHLHFEVRVNGERTDPEPFLEARGVDLPPLT
ncbi:M23 family metallopeptidase [Pseudokineococcus sp. 5B2Z-1]|uniref:M23 family metallopeptidase n=1 Tax=Pseudokineococcus sp. 5B2Z-1 TaxID=3132744 RepID=UPI0030A4F050